MNLNCIICSSFSDSCQYGGLTLAGCQVPTKLLCWFSSINRTGERNIDEKLVDSDKDRDISYQVPS